MCCDTAQALVFFLLVSVCCDTAQAFVFFLLVSMCCDTAQALVFFSLVSVCCYTAQAFVFFLLVPVCCDTALAKTGEHMHTQYECFYPRHPPDLQPSVLINIKEQSSLDSHTKKLNTKQTNKQKTRHFLIKSLL